MIHKSLHRTGICASLAAVLALAAPAQAQFGNIINRAREAVTGSDGCGESGGRSGAGGRFLGGIAGRTAGSAASRAGVTQFVPLGEYTDQLSTTIACQLDPQEQKQAADATVEATRGTEGDDRAQIGASSQWTSDTREGVSGTSTVSSRERSQTAGTDCITVTDVIIVSGEETRADKRMCRAPGSARYSIAA